MAAINPSNYSKCPKCGFSYEWNGSECNHCDYGKSFWKLLFGFRKKTEIQNHIQKKQTIPQKTGNWNFNLCSHDRNKVFQCPRCKCTLQLAPEKPYYRRGFPENTIFIKSEFVKCTNCGKKIERLSILMGKYDLR